MRETRLDGEWADSSTNLDEFRRQLERRTLEAEIFRRVGQDETVVDVDQVAAVVQQDVAVVPILHLKAG